jgi:hypothetical protein
MVPEISEFSYGFALTNELVGWNKLNSAPIFPSLIEEGKAGGGYDVQLDLPGFPLYLQFKRAECMYRRSAKQIKKIKAIGSSIATPFYRFGIMENWRSRQHEMLLELDNNLNCVFYAAPRFHKLSEINSAWTTGRVAEYSIFIQPQSIGPLPDNKSHSIAYDDAGAFFCSKARKIESFSATALMEKFSARLKHDDRALKDVLPEALADAEQIRDKVRERPLRRQLRLGLRAYEDGEPRRLPPLRHPNLTEKSMTIKAHFGSLLISRAETLIHN